MNKPLLSKILIILVLFTIHQSYGQVGINTTAPKATLDIIGVSTDTTIPDGVIAPRLTGDELKAKDNAYGRSKRNFSICDRAGKRTLNPQNRSCDPIRILYV
ncbi:hypothetical protein [Chryseobacterium gossypii]|uniref:hypothetical protein n=1 Tax=Chryseobacterium gossypii TaxID=3231602 RepID=UPI003523BC4D